MGTGYSYKEGEILDKGRKVVDGYIEKRGFMREVAKICRRFKEKIEGEKLEKKLGISHAVMCEIPWSIFWDGLHMALMEQSLYTYGFGGVKGDVFFIGLLEEIRGRRKENGAEMIEIITTEPFKKSVVLDILVGERGFTFRATRILRETKESGSGLESEEGRKPIEEWEKAVLSLLQRWPRFLSFFSRGVKRWNSGEVGWISAWVEAYGLLAALGTDRGLMPEREVGTLYSQETHKAALLLLNEWKNLGMVDHLGEEGEGLEKALFKLAHSSPIIAKEEKVFSLFPSKESYHPLILEIGEKLRRITGWDVMGIYLSVIEEVKSIKAQYLREELLHLSAGEGGGKSRGYVFNGFQIMKD